MKLKILSFIAVVMVAFFANAQAPVIASFSPTVSCAGTGTSITLSIVGSNFTGATAVSIGGLAVNTFNVVNSTHLTAVVSPFANGYISITTPKGTTLSKNVFYVSGRTDYAYIPNPYDSSVSFINLSNNNYGNIQVGLYPQNIGLSKDGSKVYVTNSGSNFLSVIDVSTNKVETNIPLGVGSHGICVSPDGLKVYTTNTNNTISVINTVSDTLITTIPVGNIPYGICINSTGTKLYVATENNVSLINTNSNLVTQIVKVANYSNGIICMSPDDSKVYCTSYMNGYVSVINALVDTLITNILFGTNLQGICISPDGGKLYVADNSNYIRAFNTSDYQSQSSIPLDQSSSSLAVSVSSDGTKIYVITAEQNLLVLDAYTYTVLRRITIYSRFLTLDNFIARIGILHNNINLVGYNSVIYKNVTYSSSTFFKDTVRNIYGCDSIYNLVNITVNKYTPKTVQVNLQDCKIVNYNNKSYFNSIILRDTVKSFRGYDSIYHITNINVTGNKILYAYFPNTGDNTVSVINTHSNKVVSTIPVGQYPIAVSASSDGNKVYVANQNSQNISIINTTNNKVTDSLSIGSKICGMVLSPDGNTLYVISAFVNKVFVINTNSKNIITIIPLLQSPDLTGGICMSPDGSKLYICGYNAKIVMVINTLTNSIIANISIGYTPEDICITPDGSKVYTANGATVSAINTADNTLITTIPIGTIYVFNADHLCMSADGRSVYVPYRDINGTEGAAISTNTNTVTSSFYFFGLFDEGIAANPDNNTIYVAGGDYNYHGYSSIAVLPPNSSFIYVTVGLFPQLVGNCFARIPGFFYDTIYITGCNNVVYNGKTYTSSTIVNEAFKNIYGCDSIFNNVNITVKKLVADTLHFNLTGCDNVLYNNRYYFNSGSFIDTTKNNIGCDSIYNYVSITVNKSTSSNIYKSICTGSSYIFNGQTYDSTGIYTVHFTSVSGCDSAITLLLTVKPLPVIPDITGSATICQGSKVTFVDSTIINLNSYEGIYLVKGYSFRAGDSVKTGNIPVSTTSLLAQDPFTIEFGSYQIWADSTNIGIGYPILSIDTSTNKVNIYSDESTLPAPLTVSVYNNPQYNSRYDPFTKTFYISFTWNNGITSRVVIDTLIYIKPDYKWSNSLFKNNIISDSGIFSANSLGYDTLAFAYTDSNGCIGAVTKVVSIAPVSIPEINISSNSTDTIISGSLVVFKASIINGGLSPTYQWFKNSIAITGATDSVYTCSDLINNDSIKCVLTSSLPCVTNSNVVSNNIIAKVKAGNYLIVTGKVVSPLTKNVPNIILNISGSTSLTEKSTGTFNLNLLNGGNYAIHPSKNNDINKTNGVTALDIALTQSHVLGKNIFNSPYKLIAADVTGDGKVTALDIVYMKRLILGIDTTFSYGTAKDKRLWSFVDSSYKFADSTNPFHYKDSISYAGLSASKINQTFIGCKLGDVNWDWNPAVARPQINNLNAVELSYSYPSDALPGRTDGLPGRTDGYVHIPVIVKNFKDMLGMQFTISFDPTVMQWQGLGNNPLGIETGTTHAAEGSISFLWVDPKNEIKTLEDGSILTELVFKAINPLNNETLEINGSVTSVVAYDKDYQSHNVVLNRVENIQALQAESWSVSPNPTKDGVIKVQMNLKDNMTVVFRLIDNTGRVLMVKQVEAIKGSNNITLREGNIAGGTYYLQAVGVEGVHQLIINN